MVRTPSEKVHPKQRTHPERVPVRLAVLVDVRVAEAVSETVSNAVALGVCEKVEFAVACDVTLLVLVGEPEPVGVPDEVTVVVWETVPLADGVAVESLVELGVGVEVLLGEPLLETVPEPVIVPVLVGVVVPVVERVTVAEGEGELLVESLQTNGKVDGGACKRRWKM